MKKLIILILSILAFVGCLNNDNPTDAVKTYLNNYINSDEELIKQLDDHVDKLADLTQQQKQIYKEILKRQYNDLTYDIENESYNGDSAVVRVNISVYDLYTIQTQTDEYLAEHHEEFNDENGRYDPSLFMDYRLEQMKNTTNKINYTVDINLTKKDNYWKVEQLKENDLKKIHGIYDYNADNLE